MSRTLLAILAPLFVCAQPVVEALFVYNAAMRPDMLPRNDLPPGGTEGRDR